MAAEGNVKALAFMEAILKPMTWDEFPKDFKMGFRLFRTPGIGWFMITAMNMFVRQVMPQAIVRKLTEEEKDHYREPFRRMSSRKPVWRWPNEIPIDGKPTDVHEAVAGYSEKLRRSELPKLLFTSSPGGIIDAPTLGWARQHLKNLTVIDIGQGIHYLQEDNPHLIGSELVKWYRGL
jgi:haloalkane dehalogenase